MLHLAVPETSPVLLQERLPPLKHYGLNNNPVATIGLYKNSPREGGSHRNISIASPLPYTKAMSGVRAVSSTATSDEKRAGISFCKDRALPEHITPACTLPDITSDGILYYDEDNDFSLEIPEGAIGRDKGALTISVGVALQGPFQFPKGLRPVSPTFWVCVHSQGNFQFSKPVTVTIPHFLHLENEDDIRSLGLIFLKAQHIMNSQGMYVFQQTDGKMDFRTLGRHGILKTTHFCSYCIACRDIEMCFQKAAFCITAVLPNCFIPISMKTYGYFFITLQNQTCLRRLQELIKKMNFVEHHDVQVDTFEFQINTDNDAALEIAIIQPGCGRIGVTGGSMV